MFMIVCGTLPTLRPWLSLLVSSLKSTVDPASDQTRETDVTFGQRPSKPQYEGFRRNSTDSLLLSQPGSAEGVELTTLPGPPGKLHIALHMTKSPQEKGLSGDMPEGPKV